MITVSQLIATAATSVIQAKQRNYRLGPIIDISGKGLGCNLYDLDTDLSIPMVWAMREEHADAEVDRIQLASNLLKNAIEALDFLKEQRLENYVKNKKSLGE